jgi:hypothetical protein
LEDPPVPRGHIRLYRGEIVPAASTLPVEAAVPSPQVAAPWPCRDRWFTGSRAKVAGYLGGGRFGRDYKRRVIYVDLPIDTAARWSLTNRFNRELDEARAHSRAWDEDYLLPPELAERAVELLPRPVDGTHLLATSAGGDHHSRQATTAEQRPPWTNEEAPPVPPRPARSPLVFPDPPGVWCSYLEHSAERGTVLGYGHMVAADGTHVLIRPEDAHQIEQFLHLWPQGTREEAPFVRVPRSSVDFQPLRREGEPPWHVRNRLHLGADRTSPHRVGDVVIVVKVDLLGRWGLAEQGVVTEVFPPGEKYAYAVTFAGEWERPGFLGGDPASREFLFRANEVSGPVPPELARVRLTEPPLDPPGAQAHPNSRDFDDGLTIS